MEEKELKTLGEEGLGLKAQFLANENLKLSDQEKDPDEGKDGYQLKWMGKNYARLLCSKAATTMIESNKAHNAKVENKDSKNILFTGDNLEVLRHLRTAYNKSVDVIYIDPPYNTGKEDDFVYPDSFDFTDEELTELLSATPEDIAKLKSLKGRSSHSAWLTFMYPRLRIARELLKDTGVIFISIDDNEQANLKLLCDEVFGEGNFVNSFMWLHGKGKKDKWARTLQQYALAYAKNKDMLNEWSELKVCDDYDFSNPDNDPKGEWFSGSVSFSEVRSNTENKNYYTVTSPSGIKWERQWQITKDEMNKLIEQGDIYFGDAPKYDNVPRIKIRKGSVARIIPDNIIDNCNTTKGAQEYLKSLMGCDCFSYPKPYELIGHIIKFIEDGKLTKDSLILDFFAGSGTTAEAVMRLNSEDGGSRHFMLVQLDEAIKKEKEAYKAGYHTIDEITKARIEKAAALIKRENSLNMQQMDLGFKHYKVKALTEKTIDDIKEFDPKIEADTLIKDDMISAVGGLEALLNTYMAEDGFKLTDEVEVVDFAGYKAYLAKSSNNHYLYILESGWDTKNTTALLNKLGLYELSVDVIVLYGYTMTFKAAEELRLSVVQSLEDKEIEVTVQKRY